MLPTEEDEIGEFEHREDISFHFEIAADKGVSEGEFSRIPHESSKNVERLDRDRESRQAGTIVGAGMSHSRSSKEGP